ncbi:MAG: hypothetical protein ACRDHV_01605 [Actinomycetota bacterium]
MASRSGRSTSPSSWDPLIPFIHTFFQARPTVWDTLFHKGFVLVPDSTGGLYSYQFRVDAPRDGAR